MSMLIAAETGRTRWWVAYGLLTCLAMYTHYTACFVLAAQFLWLLFAHPSSRLPALLANVGAAVLFMPWISGLRADLDSPTTPVLEALQGDGFDAKWTAVREWSFGDPIADPSLMPGSAGMVITTAGLLAAAVLTGFALRQRRREGPTDGSGKGPLVPLGLSLALVITVATPLGEFLISLAGTDLFGSRNMTASW